MGGRSLREVVEDGTDGPAGGPVDDRGWGKNGSSGVAFFGLQQGGGAANLISGG